MGGTGEQKAEEKEKNHAPNDPGAVPFSLKPSVNASHEMKEQENEVAEREKDTLSDGCRAPVPAVQAADGSPTQQRSASYPRQDPWKPSAHLTFEEKYELRGQIAKGAYGEIRACVPRIGKPKGAIVVKIVRHSPKTAKELRREQLIHSKVKHEYIIQLHEIFSSERYVHFVMEFAAGGDLSEAIIAEYARWRDGAGLRDRDATTATRHVLKALEYLHDQSIAHRDVKCGNILVFSSEVPLENNTFKLCDLGLAAQHSGNEFFFDAVGSPDFVSPEMLLFPPKHNELTDLWSLGVVVYMMQAARAPFESDEDIRGMYCDLRSVPWNVKSDAARKFIDTLFVAPHARPSAREHLKHQWLTCSETGEK
eukprot:TRINITY_DN7444_c0_g1_i2.p1 TRINITY_DN7444_c0_g1~~TRINITY_DN7444_c0_g1_i2.p1  ORF type:complete len:366 (-),score=69.36 TRINITY_DN7444_c0_g1_i2:166-1263(-)